MEMEEGVEERVRVEERKQEAKEEREDERNGEKQEPEEREEKKGLEEMSGGGAGLIDQIMSHLPISFKAPSNPKQEEERKTQTEQEQEERKPENPQPEEDKKQGSDKNESCGFIDQLISHLPISDNADLSPDEATILLSIVHD